MSSPAPIPLDGAVDAEQEQLDRVFFALSDPVRRAILQRLDGEALLVSQLAAPFGISINEAPVSPARIAALVHEARKRGPRNPL